MLYKLDGGIDHMLVDEAQDTSPAQWEIVRALTEEFFAGEGARDVPPHALRGRRREAVDLQLPGRRPAQLPARARDLLEARGRGGAAAVAGASRSTARSARSQPCWHAVDAVFAAARGAQRRGRAGGDAAPCTERADAPGLVELWPLALPAERDGRDRAWPLPDDASAGDEPRAPASRAAIARHDPAAGSTAARSLASTGRAVRPATSWSCCGRRGIVQELLVRALKQRGVPVAGADRLALTDHIAVQDLMALGRSLLLPEDDLNLACLLKSPLVGLDEDELFELAYGAARASLWSGCARRAAAEPARFGAAMTRLAALAARAPISRRRSSSIAWVLGRRRRPRAAARAAGPEAAEPIEAFLGAALAYEQGHPPSLQGFLHWLRSAATSSSATRSRRATWCAS